MNLGNAVIFALGVLAGAILANTGFRRRFFMGIRGLSGKGSRKEQVGQRQDSRRRHRYIECRRCQGIGRIKRLLPKISDERLASWETCPDCNGSGEIED